MSGFLYVSFDVGFFHVSAIYNRFHERRKCGGAADALIFEFFDETRLGEAGFGLCKVLVGGHGGPGQVGTRQQMSEP